MHQICLVDAWITQVDDKVGIFFLSVKRVCLLLLGSDKFQKLMKFYVSCSILDAMDLWLTENRDKHSYLQLLRSFCV